MKIGPSCGRIKELLVYDPETGIFTRKVTRGGQLKGSIAGTIDKDGYRHICIDGIYYKAARLVWVYMTGEWPDKFIDHKDLDPSNDKWDNLRLATRSQNMMNVKGKSKIFPKGVGRNGDRYTADITINHKTYHLGTFDTIKEAYNVYLEKAKELQGEYFPKHLERNF